MTRRLWRIRWSKGNRVDKKQKEKRDDSREGSWTKLVLPADGQAERLICFLRPEAPFSITCNFLLLFPFFSNSIQRSTCLPCTKITSWKFDSSPYTPRISSMAHELNGSLFSRDNMWVGNEFTTGRVDDRLNVFCIWMSLNISNWIYIPIKQHNRGMGTDNMERYFGPKRSIKGHASGSYDPDGLAICWRIEERYLGGYSKDTQAEPISTEQQGV